MEGRGLDFSCMMFDIWCVLVFMGSIKCMDFPRRNIAILWEDTFEPA